MNARYCRWSSKSAGDLSVIMFIRWLRFWGFLVSEPPGQDIAGASRLFGGSDSGVFALLSHRAGPLLAPRDFSVAQILGFSRF